MADVKNRSIGNNGNAAHRVFRWLLSALSFVHRSRSFFFSSYSSLPISPLA